MKGSDFWELEKHNEECTIWHARSHMKKIYIICKFFFCWVQLLYTIHILTIENKTYNTNNIIHTYIRWGEKNTRIYDRKVNLRAQWVADFPFSICALFSCEKYVRERFYALLKTFLCQQTKKKLFTLWCYKFLIVKEKQFSFVVNAPHDINQPNNSFRKNNLFKFMLYSILLYLCSQTFLHSTS